MQADFGCRVTPGGGVGRREAASRAPWEGLAAAGLGEGADAWAERGEVWLAGLRPHASFRGAGEGW